MSRMRTLRSSSVPTQLPAVVVLGIPVTLDVAPAVLAHTYLLIVLHAQHIGAVHENMLCVLSYISYNVYIYIYIYI